ncbi:PHP domain-containing protein [Candidatus Micrarchaeota archaeon]|nr:PHP domain-containing protein [Candidatus Micrarchaeota archaeon]
MGRNVDILHKPIPDDGLKKIDMHLHSHYSSDSCMSYDEILEMASYFGIKQLSFTDHDILPKINQINNLKINNGLVVVMGTEISAWIYETDTSCHILAYDFDPTETNFSNMMNTLEDIRFQTIQLIIPNIETTMNINFPYGKFDLEELVRNNSTYETLFKIAYEFTVHNLRDLWFGGESLSHIQAMIRDRYSRMITATSRLEARKVVSNILGAGGIPVLAHPKNMGKAEFDAFEDMGGKGIELFHRMLTQTENEELLLQCRNRKWGYTKGSDFHGHYFAVFDNEERLTKKEEKELQNFFGKDMNQIDNPREINELRSKAKNFLMYLRVLERQNRMISAGKKFTKEWRNGGNGHNNHRPSSKNSFKFRH